MKFEVHNRRSGAVQFTAEIDCADDASTSIKLGLAVQWARRRGADLAGTNLAGTNLAGANIDPVALGLIKAPEPEAA